MITSLLEDLKVESKFDPDSGVRISSPEVVSIGERGK